MAKKKTIKEFIAEARKVHGDKYDYSKVNYVNNFSDVCIICPVHGEFWQTPKHHLKECGCGECSKIERKMTTEEFIRRAREIHGDKYDYSFAKYESPETKVKLICKKHGEFFITPHSLLRGGGCKRCGYNSNKKLLFGVGINDIDGNISECGKHFPYYVHWKSMLNRCYNTKRERIYKNYKDCSVCDEWKYLSNFKKWFEENYVDGYELDKDILVKGNKIYSPSTCCFVPKEINNVIKRSVKRLKRKYPCVIENKNGTYCVTMKKRYKKITIAGIKSFQDAVNIYNEEKTKYIHELADEYYKKNMITEKVYDALKGYTYTEENERQ